MHKLYTSKTAKNATLILPKLLMKYLVEPLLMNVRYYRVTDTLGNPVVEREIVVAGK